MTDRELVQWALVNGWGWLASNKELIDLGGIQHKVKGWDDIGEKLRSRIVEQIIATPERNPSLAIVEDDDFPTVTA